MRSTIRFIESLVLASFYSAPLSVVLTVFGQRRNEALQDELYKKLISESSSIGDDRIFAYVTYKKPINPRPRLNFYWWLKWNFFIDINSMQVTLTQRMFTRFPYTWYWLYRWVLKERKNQIYYN